MTVALVVQHLPTALGYTADDLSAMITASSLYIARDRDLDNITPIVWTYLQTRSTAMPRTLRDFGNLRRREYRLFFMHVDLFRRIPRQSAVRHRHYDDDGLHHRSQYGKSLPRNVSAVT
jgi:hypothetical protein